MSRKAIAAGVKSLVVLVCIFLCGTIAVSLYRDLVLQSAITSAEAGNVEDSLSVFIEASNVSSMYSARLEVALWTRIRQLPNYERDKYIRRVTESLRSQPVESWDSKVHLLTFLLRVVRSGDLHADDDCFQLIQKCASEGHANGANGVRYVCGVIRKR